MANQFGFGGGSTTTTQGANAFGFGGNTAPIEMSDPSGFNQMYQSSGESLYDQDLIEDRNFVEASKIIYEMNNGKNATALSDDRAYAEYGIEMMGWFNWNLPKMSDSEEELPPGNLLPERLSGGTQKHGAILDCRRRSGQC